ncbi:tetratricopeptide repeat protein [Thioalkalivibrio sp. XN279]|uniref:tetratricopeptide repeat protein n=1 Tax=Thioalkalivibrio sp. XN279 TaxID=2714953 RepID=UPI00140C3ED0|nr:tetratricopeptide repeat protein [Thioalkalivibrio sp. XN279]NHA15849.1 tetratricopeptide repeat protein [Thioalkalivibrio sp. XN279]
MRAALEKLLAAGRDDALLRFSLGNACLQERDTAAATGHLRRAVEHDPAYSAAWKLLGKALDESGDHAGAAAAWRSGIEAAEARGDVQAAKEMQVFLKRLQKRAGDAPA